MSRFPIHMVSDAKRQRLLRELIKLRETIVSVDQQIDRERRIVFYRYGYEIADAQLLAVIESATHALHARMQTLEELRTTAAQMATFDARSLVALPTRRRCACCDEPIYNQFNRCAGKKHCLCPLCFVDLLMKAPMARQCLRCLDADTSFSSTYDVEPNIRTSDSASTPPCDREMK